MPRFNVGQSVRVVRQTHAWGGHVREGDIGVIASTPDEGGNTYAVDFPNNRGWIGREECFEHIAPNRDVIGLGEVWVGVKEETTYLFPNEEAAQEWLDNQEGEVSLFKAVSQTIETTVEV
jgi:hypothetical protein